MLATGNGTFHLDGSPRMRQRPIADLLDALNGLGAGAKSDLGTGCPPVTIDGQRARRRLCVRQGRRLEPVPERPADGVALFPSGSTTVEVQGVLVSQPYVAMTLAVMEAFGVTIGNRKFRRFDVQPAPLPRPRLRDRARRLGRQLLLRPGGDHGGQHHRRGPGHVEHPGRHGVRGRPRAHGLHGRPRAGADDRHGGPAPRRSTST